MTPAGCKAAVHREMRFETRAAATSPFRREGRLDRPAPGRVVDCSLGDDFRQDIQRSEKYFLTRQLGKHLYPDYRYLVSILMRPPTPLPSDRREGRRPASGRVMDFSQDSHKRLKSTFHPESLDKHLYSDLQLSGFNLSRSSGSST